MDSQENQSSGSSRRSFLKKMPLGLVGVFALTSIGGSLLRRGRKKRTQVVFAKDSIFRPRDSGPQGT